MDQLDDDRHPTASLKGAAAGHSHDEVDLLVLASPTSAAVARMQRPSERRLQWSVGGDRRKAGEQRGMQGGWWSESSIAVGELPVVSQLQGQQEVDVEGREEWRWSASMAEGAWREE